VPLPQPRHEIPFEIDLVLVRVDYVASLAINANFRGDKSISAAEVMPWRAQKFRLK
jgi:hypothetical protein